MKRSFTMNGLFITLEGCDGLGKSKQATLLQMALEARGHNVFSTKEPGTADGAGSPLGAVVRDSVFHLAGSGRTLPEGAQQLYLLLDHIDNVSRFEPYLRDGYTVICDRYSDSAFAYASVYNPPTSGSILHLWEQYRGPLPDVTILLVAVGELVYDDEFNVYEDISWALTRAQARLGEEAGKQQGKGWNDKKAQRMVQQTYVDLLSNQPRTLIVPIVATDSVSTVHLRIMTMIDRWISEQTELHAQLDKLCQPEPHD
jgi:thymidylate kinase